MDRLCRWTVTLVTLAALLIFFPVHFAKNLFLKWIQAPGAMPSGGFMAEVYAVTLISLEEALHTMMPEADQFTEEIQKISREDAARIEKAADLSVDREEFYFYAAKKEGRVLGYVGADSVAGKWGPIHYLVAFTPAGEVKDVVVVEYQEKRGRPVARSRFLKQFFGKTAADEIKLMKDIRGVTGATISSRGMTDGIRKMLYVFNDVYRAGAKS